MDLRRGLRFAKCDGISQVESLLNKVGRRQIIQHFHLFRDANVNNVKSLRKCIKMGSSHALKPFLQKPLDRSTDP